MGNVIYRGDVEDLEGHAPLGDGECVALVKALTNVGPTSTWRPGPRVTDLYYLNPGTVIANFVFDEKGVGRFPNRHGYHAGLFMRFGGRSVTTGRVMSIIVMDQWRGRPVRARTIEAFGARTYVTGMGHRDCDNADQFYVVVK